MNEQSKIAAPGSIRDEFEKLVLADLHGPAGGPDEEVDEASMSDRYLAGMLAPRRTPGGGELLEGLEVGGRDSREDGKTDITAPQAATLIPSSFGTTFAVAVDATAIKVTARWGHYLRVDSATLTTDKGNPKKVWKRTPRQATSAPIALTAGPIKQWVVTSEQPEVMVRGLIRKNAGDWIITLFLVNNQKEQKPLNDEQWLFQPELSVAAPDGSAIFVKRQHFHDPEKADSATIAEERSMAMLYRHQVEFAVGHNVAVHAEPVPDNPDRAVRVSTRCVPTYEVPTQDTADEGGNPCLGHAGARHEGAGGSPTRRPARKAQGSAGRVRRVDSRPQG